jgi:hypothetical protein
MRRDLRVTRLRFAAAPVSELIAHALAAPEHSKGYGDNGPGVPALVFVKDEGIYLMSSGIPGIDCDGRPIPKATPRGHVHKQNKVVYADGFGEEASHEAMRAAVGGDDFAEYLPVDQRLADDLKRAVALVLDVTPRSVSVIVDFGASNRKPN